jgi:hypothetical protein
MNDALTSYATRVVQQARREPRRGELFAKVLSGNDDAGRHGVLIPMEAYSFFPDFSIRDPGENATIEFRAFDAVNSREVVLGYKYYQRYPERRITRLPGIINNRANNPRIVVFLRIIHADGSSGYYVDCAASGVGGRFEALFAAAFLPETLPTPGAYISRPLDSTPFTADETLVELLSKFDVVKDMGWVASQRSGDTGIGYTFESLLGIQENNDRRADYKGIELKCKAVKEGAGFARGKINLFQQGPVWTDGATTTQRIQLFGKRQPDGRWTCNSQITTQPNNRNASLSIVEVSERIKLLRAGSEHGYWLFSKLEERLQEKHSRAAIVKAKVRISNGGQQFKYEEFIYCERPSIDKFIALVRNRNIVFEFLMKEEARGPRNRGYPWRLVREEFLDQLYSFQLKLR